MLDISSNFKVTVVDDDAEDRDALVEELADFGCTAEIIEGQYASDIDRMINDVVGHESDLVICDYKLQPQRLASFSGAELVAQLFTLNIPSILLTMYKSPARVDILRLRDRIPVVVGRDEFDQEKLSTYLDVCKSEIDGVPIDSRRPHRVVIRVEEFRSVNQHDFVCDVVVPSWRPGHAVTVPKECFAKTLWGSIKAGDRYLGCVNIDAANEDELYMTSISKRVEID